MRVLMRTTMAGPDGVISAGREVELSDDRAGVLIAAGYAVAVAQRPIVSAIAGAGPPAARRARAVAGPQETR